MPRKVNESTMPPKVKRAARPRVKTAEAVSSTSAKTKRAHSRGEVAAPTLARKAPTELSGPSAPVRKTRRHILVVVGLLLVGAGASAAVGLSDTGQIDVVAAIEERNKRAEERGEPVISVSVQNTPQLPDGGLIPTDPNAPLVGVPPTTASSSESTATSTAGNVPLTESEAASAFEAAQATSS
jgi:hypothetical protein